MPSISKSSHTAYTWSVNFNIISKNPISFLKIPTHNMIILNQNNDKTIIDCCIDSSDLISNKPNKDVVLLYRSDDIDKPIRIILVISMCYDNICARFC